MHEDTIAKLSAFLDDELLGQEREALERELEGSGTLRHELDKLRAARDWARDFPGRLPESDVWASIEDNLTAAATSTVAMRKRRSWVLRFFDAFAFDPSQWSSGVRRAAVFGLAGVALAGMGRSLVMEQRAGSFEEKNRLRDEQLLQRVAEGDWSQTAGALRGRDGSVFQVRCPQGGQLRAVWGSGVYTDDSSICTAAVHAGLIRLGSGGLVNIHIVPGRSEYRGSLQNGIETRVGRWSGKGINARSAQRDTP